MHGRAAGFSLIELLVVLVLLALASAAVVLSVPPADPLREGQRHCQQLGEAAANDPTCLRIWAETRDRFLGRTPGPATPAPNGGK